jgi:hypothetical protein
MHLVNQQQQILIAFVVSVCWLASPEPSQVERSSPAAT